MDQFDTVKVSESEEHYLKQLEITNKKLQQANDIIEKSSMVIFDWSIGPGIPVKFVTKNISLYGYSEEDFYTGKVDYWDFVYEKDVEATQRKVWIAREQQRLNEYKHIYRVKCKNGELRWVEEWTILERNSEGELISEKGVLRDITEQVETAEKLRQSEERYRNLFENAAALICTHDLRGNFTSVNNSFVHSIGYSREEFLRMNVQDITIKEKLPRIDWNDLESTIKLYLNTTIQLPILTKDNRTMIIEGRHTFIHKEGVPYEIQFVGQDVTSRLEAEQHINHLTFHDKLTGLYNRAYFDEETRRLDEKGELPYSVIIGDMNGLKLANDAFGHKAGDALLVKTAQILQSVCGSKGLVARLSGDEFAIVLPGCTEIECIEICNNIMESCNKCCSCQIPPSIALGYSVKKDSCKALEDIIREADDNMYKSKLKESKSNRSTMIALLQTALGNEASETRENIARALAELRRCSRTQLDPELMDVFTTLILNNSVS